MDQKEEAIQQEKEAQSKLKSYMLSKNDSLKRKQEKIQIYWKQMHENEEEIDKAKQTLRAAQEQLNQKKLELDLTQEKLQIQAQLQEFEENQLRQQADKIKEREERVEKQLKQVEEIKHNFKILEPTQSQKEKKNPQFLNNKIEKVQNMYDKINALETQLNDYIERDQKLKEREDNFIKIEEQIKKERDQVIQEHNSATNSKEIVKKALAEVEKCKKESIQRIKDKEIELEEMQKLYQQQQIQVQENVKVIQEKQLAIQSLYEKTSQEISNKDQTLLKSIKEIEELNIQLSTRITNVSKREKIIEQREKGLQEWDEELNLNQQVFQQKLLEISEILEAQKEDLLVQNQEMQDESEQGNFSDLEMELNKQKESNKKIMESKYEEKKGDTNES